MDKYQKYLMDFKDSYYKFAINGQISKDKILIENKIVLTQNEDISISDYVLYIANESIDSVFAIKGNNQKELKKEVDADCKNGRYGNNENRERFFIAIDFEDRFDGIKIIFKNNLADDLLLPIEYVVADKEKYYAKKEQERRDDLLKIADIKVSTGTDLVNIYFQPCADTYSKTVIEVYTATGKFEQQHIHHCITFINESAPAKLLGGTINMMIGQFKVEQGMFFKSITGLAHGVYAIKLIQFDANGNELLKSDDLFFIIR